MFSIPVMGSSEPYALHPGKIIGVGLNYADHVKESTVFNRFALELPKEPVIFAKTTNVLIPSGEEIIIPSFIKDYGFEEPRVDLEAELAVIIGKTAKRVSEKDALAYVFGYTCFNDVSQRNIQKGDASGWFRGKSLDTFGPIGPVIVRAVDMPNPQNCRITSRINGRPCQESNTSYMIFPVARLVSWISSQITLYEGDIIATGTPSGVSALRHGDSVEIEIEGIGILRNPVREE